jgi:uncharacterized protein YndB with AHSA1/START domain
MTQSIRHKFVFNHPVEVVWDHLTKAELIEKWLMKNNFQPIPGYEFQFTTRAVPQLNFDGIVYCKVLEIVPLKKLSYSWKSGPGNKEITIDSVVVWTLHPKDNGTELLLDHSGVDQGTDLAMYSALTEGWLKNIQKMNENIKTA